MSFRIRGRLLSAVYVEGIFDHRQLVQVESRDISAAKREEDFVLKGRPYTCACMNGFMVSVDNHNYCVVESDASSCKTS